MVIGCLSKNIESGLDDDLTQDMLSCLEIGNCGFKELNDGSVAVDLAFELDAKEAKLSRDPKTNDLIIHKARILSPGTRNQFEYPLESVKLTRHLKKDLELSAMPSPFIGTGHSSDPLKQIGRVDDLYWSDEEQSIVGDPRIYDDPRLPLAQAAIALLEREKGFMSLSTRLKVQPYIENATGKQYVRDLRLIHVAWVDVGADPTAGKDLSNAVDDEIVDNPYPNEHACRLREPANFQKGSMRRDERNHNGKKYSIIMGKLTGQTSMTEQAYRYNIDEWTASEAQTHCKDHNGKTFEKASGATSAYP